MSFFDWIEIFIFVSLLLCIVPLLGNYMAQVFQGEKTILYAYLNPIENFTYRIAKIDPNEEMGWKKYIKAMLLFNLLGFLLLFIIQLLQSVLPLNQEHFRSVPWDLAFNTAISFVTNTNWQAYAGEGTLSILTQMGGLTVQNFLSAATGCSALLALIRGITRKSTATIGNFWVDFVRSIIYILLPLSFIFAVVLVSQGVVQTFSSYQKVITLEQHQQVIPLGPVASQVAIKQLGTNGGGFFNANSAHPFENPNALTNFLELLAIVLIPTALTYAYGSMIGSKRHGWLLFLAMFLLWSGGLIIAIYSELMPNPLMNAAPLMEGKETRFGLISSILWSVTTSATANGSVNAMLSSLSPLAGGVALFNIMLGELVFGGVGVGLCSMLMFVFLTIFLSGLMVGRSPEYRGKKIEKKEILWTIIAVLAPCLLILVGSGISSVVSMGIASLGNGGPHGLTEILYAFTSASGNNGSAFASLNANTMYYNLILGLVMVLARIAILVPSVAIGGLFAEKKTAPPSVGAISTDTVLFLFLLLGVILIVGALTFFPALTLGPLVEHLLMLKGQAF